MYKLIRESSDALEAAKLLDNTKPLFCDTETCIELGKTKGGLYGLVRLVQVYQEGMKEALIFDCFFIELSEVLDIIKDFAHVYHNASYDLHTINCHTDELWLPTDVDDTIYMSRIEYSSQTKFDFYSCLSHAGVSDRVIAGIDKPANQKADWSRKLTTELLEYAAYDVLYLSLMYKKLEHIKDTFVYKLDIDNLKYAINYDRLGLTISSVALNKLKREFIILSEKYSTLCPVNVNSPKQCCEWLSISSSDAETLGVMALEGDDRAENLLNARKYDKALSFIENYSNDIVRGFHNSCGTRTGRMSCSGGDRYYCNNTQQPPRIMFECIRAPEGKVFIYKDYSGLELRTAVSFVGEPTMSKMMFDGVDLHTYTGCYLFDKTPETLSDEKRIITKFFNFGTIYGAGPTTLRGLLRSQGRINLPLKEVTSIRNKWLQMYNYFEQWHSMHKRHMSVYGYLDTTTALGRKIRAYSLPDSFNFPIQGTAAEVTKTAVRLLHQRYEQLDIVNVVHDSIGLLKNYDEADMWVDRLNECMIDAWFFVIKDYAIPDLPMPKEACIKKSWGDKGVTSLSQLDFSELI
jgi:DNA polymerase I-like protein with 3'-5' exonuclease and polymerase domains